MAKKIMMITGWVISAALAFVFFNSAWGKLGQGNEALQMAAGIGIQPDDFFVIGMVETVAVILFLIPRTAVLGSLLLIAYMGGAIASHLGHDKPLMFPILVSCLLWIAACLRLPELRQRLFFGKKNM